MNAHTKNLKASPRVQDVQKLFDVDEWTIIPLHTPFATSPRKGKKHADGKRPLHGRWQSKPYNSKKVLREYGGTNNLGIRLTPSQLVIDIDPRHGGDKGLRKLKKFLGDDLTGFPTVITGSGGLHIFMAKPQGVAVLDSVEQFPGVEFKSAGRQVVAAGSIHPDTGKRYKHDDFTPGFDPLPRAPKALLKLIKRPPPPANQGEGGEVTPETLETWLAVLNPENYPDNETWFPFMAACHHATGGEGREEFIEWSTGDPQYADDRYMIGRRWDSLSATRDGAVVTKATLFKALKEAGHADMIPADNAAELFEDESEDELADKSKKPTKADRLTYQVGDNVDPKSVDWSWQNILVRGALNLIAGHPGEGKSQLSCNIAATITKGRKWPDGGRAEQGKVVILSAEDTASTTIVPRLMAAGADLSKILIVESMVKEIDQKGKRTFNLADDIEQLTNLFEDHPEISMLIVDPISAYLGGKSKGDTHKNSDVRALMTPLANWSAKHEVTTILVTHLNKNGQGRALARVSESLAFTALARSAYLVTPEETVTGGTERKLFLRLKNNLAPDQGGFAFKIEGATVAGDIPTSRIAWEAGRVQTTADEAMTAIEKGFSTVEKAGSFLGNVLKDGAVLVSKIKEWAESNGHAWAAVRSAKKALGVISQKQGGEGHKDAPWEWVLPNELSELE